MLNEVNLMGRLVKNPELRRTGTGVSVTSFRIAVDRDNKPKDAERPEADFFDCVAWRGSAEFIERYFGKGRTIIVHGKLRQRGYTTKEGEKRQTVEVEVENAYFGDSKRLDSITNRDTNAGGATQSYYQSETDYSPDEDLDTQFPY